MIYSSQFISGPPQISDRHPFPFPSPSDRPRPRCTARHITRFHESFLLKSQIPPQGVSGLPVHSSVYNPIRSRDVGEQGNLRCQVSPFSWFPHLLVGNHRVNVFAKFKSAHLTRSCALSVFLLPPNHPTTLSSAQVRQPSSNLLEHTKHISLDTLHKFCTEKPRGLRVHS